MPVAYSFDDTPLWYDIQGHGKGDPVLLIAGSGCDHSVWDPVISDFIADRRVIVYDHRGTGKSGSNLNATWTTRDFARDAFEVLRNAGVARAHVYGHSMGGRVAQWLAFDRPTETGSLVLGASSVGEIRGIPRSAEAIKAMQENDSTRLRDMCYPETWFIQNHESALAGEPNPHDRESFMSHLRASSEHDSWDIAAFIRSPTLIIHGSEDGITHPRNAEILAGRIPKAQLLILDKARHVYWAGRPEVHRIVSTFFRDAE
ncbi:alpha/beta fold hydrolase [Pectobacterium brasiliense]|uniref:alpha/beta fold hydrolase n=1 Tax=Pectobacterium brasiliense TaxID=180957 RepID=UPI0015DD8561|nr:alpha/beta fold hydrolase [Pectobacterium brasiliense]MBA0212703.1 alpha/beta fold hydrolase [Pectobacterium brasiliense]